MSESTHALTSPDDLLTPREVAAITRLKLQTLADHRWRKVGIAYLKLGKGPRGHVRYRRRDVDAYLTDPIADVDTDTLLSTG